MGDKPLFHYLLMEERNRPLAEKEWNVVRDYVAVFQPTLGFLATDAVRAEHVTIVGGVSAVSKDVEDWLKANGCKVDRIASATAAGIKQIMDKLASEGKRFLSMPN